ncbi:MAG: hypothetical protein MMC33_001205 [Icmadophila ericetorum]|nr:hypothetical protein [Icmadophila ericetorum]
MSTNRVSRDTKNSTEDDSTFRPGDTALVEPQPAVQRFTPEEETTLLNESHSQKAEANKLYSAARYSEAIGTYDKALASCPNYLEYELAVLKSNIAACHIKLEDWKAAVESATSALEALDRLPKGSVDAKGGEDLDVGVVEIEDGEEGDKQLEDLRARDERREDVRKLRTKAVLRRARARVELGGWADLAGAEEDYKELSQLPNLPAQDMKVVRGALASLPSRINAAKEKEMGEMMGKLKGLGNTLLKPFGLSTDMFQMTQDPATGGYSMSFNNSGQ